MLKIHKFSECWTWRRRWMKLEVERSLNSWRRRWSSANLRTWRRRRSSANVRIWRTNGYLQCFCESEERTNVDLGLPPMFMWIWRTNTDLGFGVNDLEDSIENLSVKSRMSEIEAEWREWVRENERSEERAMNAWEILIN
jgi:hypothetical protein